MNSTVLDEKKEYDCSSVDCIDYEPSSKYSISIEVARKRILKQLEIRKKRLMSDN